MHLMKINTDWAAFSNELNEYKSLISVVKNWLRALLASNVANVIIICVSIVMSFVFFSLASHILTGIWHEFLINISASMLAIGLTVIVVDVLREYRLERQYKLPREIAFKRIAGSHAGLFVKLTIKYSSIDNSISMRFRSNIKRISDDSEAYAKAGLIAARELESLSAQDIVINYTDDELMGSFKNQLTTIRTSYADTSSKYMFSFRDPSMRAEYVDLLENIDAVILAIRMVEISGSEHEKLLKPTDPRRSIESIDANAYVGLMLVGYIKVFNKFMKKNYGDLQDAL